MTNIKEANKSSKIDICEIIRDNIHNNNTSASSQGYYHYATVLPSRQNSGWCDQGIYWN